MGVAWHELVLTSIWGLNCGRKPLFYRLGFGSYDCPFIHGLMVSYTAIVCANLALASETVKGDVEEPDDLPGSLGGGIS